MANNNQKSSNDRRRFLGSLASGAAAVGLATITPTLAAHAAHAKNFRIAPEGDPDEWFKKINGKHRIVFDATAPHEVFPFAWPRVFLATNAATGTEEKDCSVVLILRHNAIAYAFNDSLWEKYKFGETFKINDENGKPRQHNPFWKPAPGTYSIPGMGPVKIGINELQESGVMICVCDAATTVFSALAAGKMNKKPEDVKSEWVAAVLPDIQLVPSGVWAVGRAQEHGCAYCAVM